jgi:hypothetical protein
MDASILLLDRASGGGDQTVRAPPECGLSAA